MEFIDSPYLGRNTGFRCSRRRESTDKSPYVWVYQSPWHYSTLEYNFVSGVLHLYRRGYTRSKNSAFNKRSCHCSTRYNYQVRFYIRLFIWTTCTTPYSKKLTGVSTNAAMKAVQHSGDAS